MVSHACIMQRSNGLAADVGNITVVVMVYICTVGDVYMFSQPVGVVCGNICGGTVVICANSVRVMFGAIGV